MSGLLNGFYDTYILLTPVEVPQFVYVLAHLFFIVPINLAAFFLVYKTRNMPLKKRERLLKLGALCMGLVMIMRYALYAVYVNRENYFKTIIKFEMSEIAMYLLMLAIFVIKKQWFYPLAFTVGLISCIALFGFPYTVFSNYTPFHLYTVSSVFFHALNGYMACMLLTARGYVPRLKHLFGVFFGNIILFCIILLANKITGENFMALSDASKLPIIYMTKPPVNVIIIYIVYNFMSFAVLGVSELIYRKAHVTELSHSGKRF